MAVMVNRTMTVRGLKARLGPMVLIHPSLQALLFRDRLLEDGRRLDFLEPGFILFLEKEAKTHLNSSNGPRMPAQSSMSKPSANGHTPCGPSRAGTPGPDRRSATSPRPAEGAQAEKPSVNAKTTTSKVARCEGVAQDKERKMINIAPLVAKEETARLRLTYSQPTGLRCRRTAEAPDAFSVWLIWATACSLDLLNSPTDRPLFALNAGLMRW